MKTSRNKWIISTESLHWDSLHESGRWAWLKPESMKYTHLFFLALSLFLIPACSGGDSKAEAQAESEAESEEPASMSDAVKQMEEAVQQMQKGEGVEVVDFRKLKDMLPDKLAGAKKVSSSGEKTGAMGFKVSQAEAQYEDGDKRFEVDIVDAGGMSMVINSMAAWASVELDRETEEGYERTTEIDGFKAFEEYNSRRQEGKVSLLVGERYIVNIEGDQIKAKDLRRAIDDLDLKKLARLK